MVDRVKELEALLQKEQKRIKNLLESLEAEGLEPQGPDHSDHPAEWASGLSQREYNEGEKVSLRHILAEIAHAMDKIQRHPEKVFKCDKCGKDIEDARVKAKPWARYCLTCRSRYEKSFLKRK